MECEFVRDHIDVYLDGEFDLTDRRLFEEHVRYCGPCREAYGEQRGFLGRLRNGLREGLEPAPVEMRERLASVLQLHRPGEAARGWTPALAVGALAAAVALVVVLVRPAPTPPSEFRGTSLATQEFVQQEFGHPVRLPLEEDADTRLVGARLVRDEAGPAVIFLYETQGRALSVLQRPEELPLPGPAPERGPGSLQAVPVHFQQRF
jgi:hypothetical protein